MSKVVLLTYSSIDTVWELLNELGYTFDEPYSTAEGLEKVDIVNEEGVCVAFTEEFPQIVVDKGHAYSLGYWHGYKQAKYDNPFKPNRDEYHEYGEGYTEGDLARKNDFCEEM